MTSGIQYHLIDYAGLVPAVAGDRLNDLKADNDEFAQADFDLKARKIMDAGIQHEGIIPAKAGALLMKADAGEAFKAWGIVYGGQSMDADLGRDNGAKIINFAPFAAATAAKETASALNADFGNAASGHRPYKKEFSMAVGQSGFGLSHANNNLSAPAFNAA